MFIGTVAGFLLIGYCKMFNDLNTEISSPLRIICFRSFTTRRDLESPDYQATFFFPRSGRKPRTPEKTHMVAETKCKTPHNGFPDMILHNVVLCIYWELFEDEKFTHGTNYKNLVN